MSIHELELEWFEKCASAHDEECELVCGVCSGYSDGFRDCKCGSNWTGEGPPITVTQEEWFAFRCLVKHVKEAINAEETKQ